jgi:putative ABC transport system permease protein
MLSKEYIAMISLALMVATPIAYYGIDQWLKGFAYAIEIQWWLFLAPGMIVLILAWIT